MSSPLGRLLLWPTSLEFSWDEFSSWPTSPLADFSRVQPGRVLLLADFSFGRLLSSSAGTSSPLGRLLLWPTSLEFSRDEFSSWPTSPLADFSRVQPGRVLLLADFSFGQLLLLADFSRVQPGRVLLLNDFSFDRLLSSSAGGSSPLGRLLLWPTSLEFSRDEFSSWPTSPLTDFSRVQPGRVFLLADFSFGRLLLSSAGTSSPLGRLLLWLTSLEFSRGEFSSWPSSPLERLLSFSPWPSSLNG